MYQYVKQNYPPLIIFAAAAAMIFASCQKSLNDVDSRREIRMEATMLKFDTKAFTEATNTTLQTSGFKAAAVIDADNSVMFNKAMTYNNTAGCYGISGEHYYFPNEGTISLYGIYPADEVIAIASDGKATLAYAHNSDDDLIGAVKKNVASQDNAVAMDFKHLLSQVSISAKTDDDNLVCKLYSITINDVNGGTYSFADDSWTLSEKDSAYVFFNSTAGQALTTTAAAVGAAMSFMPGEVTLNAKWKCYNKIGEQLISDNDETVPVTLTKGKHLAITLLLPANSTEMKLSSSVEAWVSDPQELKAAYVPELLPGVFTVDGSGKKVKFTKGNLYWNGSAFRCETNQYDYPAAWDATHVGHFFWSKDARLAYAADYNAVKNEFGITHESSDSFFADNGGVFEGLTMLTMNEWEYLTKNLSYKDEGPAIASGIDAFAYIIKGITLEEFDEEDCEELKKNEEFLEVEYKFRSADKETVNSWTYEYIKSGFRDRQIADFVYYIAGKKCFILKPDGFSGEIADSYTAEEWSIAESTYGLVALPIIGKREGTSISKEEYGLDNSLVKAEAFSTLTNSLSKKNYNPRGKAFMEWELIEPYNGGINLIRTPNDSCSNGRSVRLVQVQPTE